MDQNALAGMESLPEAQKQELLTRIEEMQVRDSLRMYNALVEKCFRDCVEGFRRKDLDAGEERCVQRCCEKYIKHSARVGMRFAELSQVADQQMQEIMAQQQGKQ